MFRRKRRTAYPAGGSVVTTTRTHRTSRPHHHHQTHHHAGTTGGVTSGAGIMSRLRPRRNTPVYTTSSSGSAFSTGHRTGFGRRNKLGAAHHTTTTAAPHHHHHSSHATVVPARKTSVGDKVSGAMMKLRGSLTGRPGLKGAGTRRMHGTDGRGTRRYY